ncbi:MAG: proline--tRNA ligase [Candidatus Dojkabacteria bacterium]|nr:MAG: proline--tRNA ligase [Candidatus Dojkabacteria bacterium]
MNGLPSMSENFGEWYQQVILRAGLADYGPVKGTMIFKGYGYTLWKNVQKYLGEMIEKDGVEDVYFPMFIPQSYLSKEKEHVEGFAPEVAVVTHAGGEKLEEPLVIRPTSETIMYKTFANWIQSYRDLPLKINQWANVVRWEKRTTLFMRTSEFLWQEGHTAHATKESADADVFEALHRYDDFLRTYMAIPSIKGYKTSGEKFAGADYTTTLEVLLRSNKALQIGTSHQLGQNFAKAFDVKFVDENNQQQYAWQTSWGFSTRSLGGMIGVHGDDKGLQLPPRMAAVQIVIIPIFKTPEGAAKIKDMADKLIEKGKSVGIRMQADWSENTAGWKFNEWELRGVPLRIEIGERELAEEKLKVVRRVDGSSVVLQYANDIHKQLQELLDESQAMLFRRAEEFLNEHTRQVNSEAELVQALDEGMGFVVFFFNDDKKQADILQEKYKITPRVIPLATENEIGKDIFTGKEGKLTYFAKAY